MDNETTGIVEENVNLTDIETVEPADAGDDLKAAELTETSENVEAYQEVTVASGNDYTAVLESIDLKLTFMVVVLVLAIAWFCWKKLVQYLDMFFK